MQELESQVETPSATAVEVRSEVHKSGAVRGAHGCSLLHASPEAMGKAAMDVRRDAACSGLPSDSAPLWHWASVETDDLQLMGTQSGPLPGSRQTNNRAELFALIKAAEGSLGPMVELWIRLWKF